MNSTNDTLAGGLSHSEIPGSQLTSSSPKLIAGSHVLHRLSVPRHPPQALSSLIILTYIFLSLVTNSRSLQLFEYLDETIFILTFRLYMQFSKN